MRFFKRWLYEEPYITVSFIFGGIGLAAPALSQYLGYIDKEDPWYQEPPVDLTRDLDYNRCLSDGKAEYTQPVLRFNNLNQSWEPSGRYKWSQYQREGMWLARKFTIGGSTPMKLDNMHDFEERFAN